MIVNKYNNGNGGGGGGAVSAETANFALLSQQSEILQGQTEVPTAQDEDVASLNISVTEWTDTTPNSQRSTKKGGAKSLPPYKYFKVKDLDAAIEDGLIVPGQDYLVADFGYEDNEDGVPNTLHLKWIQDEGTGDYACLFTACKGAEWETSDYTYQYDDQNPFRMDVFGSGNLAWHYATEGEYLKVWVENWEEGVVVPNAVNTHNIGLIGLHTMKNGEWEPVEKPLKTINGESIIGEGNISTDEPIIVGNAESMDAEVFVNMLSYARDFGRISGVTLCDSAGNELYGFEIGMDADEITLSGITLPAGVYTIRVDTGDRTEVGDDDVTFEDVNGVQYNYVNGAYLSINTDGDDGNRFLISSAAIESIYVGYPEDPETGDRALVIDIQYAQGGGGGDAVVHLDTLSGTGAGNLVYECDDHLWYWDANSGVTAEWTGDFVNNEVRGVGLIYSYIPEGQALLDFKNYGSNIWRTLKKSGDTITSFEGDTVIEACALGETKQFNVNGSGFRWVKVKFDKHYIGFTTSEYVHTQNKWDGKVSSAHWGIVDHSNYPYLTNDAGIPQWDENGRIIRKVMSPSEKTIFVNTTSYSSFIKVLKTGETSFPDRFWVPTTGGDAGQVLTSNGSGAPTWATMIKAVKITSQAYEDLQTKDPNTLYLIDDE